MKRYTISAAVVASILMASSCTTKDAQAEAERQQTAIEKQEVTATSEVVVKSVAEELALNGDVTCDETLLRKIFVPCTGKVSGLSVEIGDFVNQGQRLAVIHSEGAADYRKSLNDADAEIRMAERERDLQRDLQASGMASDKDLAEAEERVIVAKAERQRLREVANINGYGGQSNASLVAPISGYVIAKQIYNDSYVSDDNNDEPAIQVANLKRVWVVADVYESDIAKIHQGADVSVTTMAYPDDVFYGKIEKIYSMLDNESKTMKVRVSLENVGMKLKPGMFASVHVQMAGNGQQALCVPSSAVLFENGHDYVMVETSKGHYERQEVKVLKDTGDWCFLTQGVKKGQRVVSKNALLYFNANGNE